MLVKVIVLVAAASLAYGHPQPTRSDVEEGDYHPDFEDETEDLRKERVSEDEYTAEYWKNGAFETINSKRSITLNTNVAKNTILFLGDGMSIPTLVAARIYMGQLEDATGEESVLSFEKFPYTGLSKTYCVNRQTPDSACTATAYLCGVKNNYGTIGVTANVTRYDCEAGAVSSNQVTSLGRWSQLAGKRTGLVTTTRVTHASPAGVYAHTANRGWESDTDAISDGADPEVCRDIAYQAVYGETGENLHVILGGGRRAFLPSDVVDEEGSSGTRTDGLNLVQAWLDRQSQKGQAEYVWNRDQLLNVTDDTDYLLGLFEASHMEYHIEGDETEPTLEEMTEAAINILSKGEDGFFLFVEGGRIDHAHHSTYAKKSLDETVEFSKAIERALELTNSDDTLIVVTSDHAHTFSVSGYPTRGHDILGTAGTGTDGLPYATLSYANGPGYALEADGSRHNLSEDDMHGNSYRFPKTVPLSSETHGADDVGIFAYGPWAHLLTGVVEQNVIPYVMAYASCVGDGVTACESVGDTDSSATHLTVEKVHHFVAMIMVILFSSFWT